MSLTGVEECRAVYTLCKINRWQTDVVCTQRDCCTTWKQRNANSPNCCSRRNQFQNEFKRNLTALSSIAIYSTTLVKYCCTIINQSQLTVLATDEDENSPIVSLNFRLHAAEFTLTVAQLVKTILFTYQIRRFITVFTKTRHDSYDEPNHSVHMLVPCVLNFYWGPTSLLKAPGSF